MRFACASRRPSVSFNPCQRICLQTAGRSIELKFRTASDVLIGVAYVTTFMLPNCFFHVTTAHDILRHHAVDVGKRGFLGSFETP